MWDIKICVTERSQDFNKSLRCTKLVNGIQGDKEQHLRLRGDPGPSRGMRLFYVWDDWGAKRWRDWLKANQVGAEPGPTASPPGLSAAHGTILQLDNVSSFSEHAQMLYLVLPYVQEAIKTLRTLRATGLWESRSSAAGAGKWQVMSASRQRWPAAAIYLMSLSLLTVVHSLHPLCMPHGPFSPFPLVKDGHLTAAFCQWLVLGEDWWKYQRVCKVTTVIAY